MPAPSLSIVIPTHKRATLLRKCLEHLEAQTIAHELEVIVVSDGHDPETAALFAEIPNRKSQIPIWKCFEIPKSQQGIARNRGVEKASASIVLFAQDDIFLDPSACEKHLRSHTHSNPAGESRGFPLRAERAVLGFTTWDPALEITPVMRWLEKTGWQFGYPLLEPYRHATIPTELQHRFSYTSHISVPTDIAKKIPFREDVSLYGWEDMEWGMRLRDAGVGLFYEPDAVAYHHHPLTLEGSLKRMETIGQSAVALKRINPELDRLPQGWKWWAYRMLALLPTMRGRHAKAFVTGIRSAKHAHLT